ncbi:MAG TPA: hypothetical protein VGU71_04400 [Candidatus Dormibacteraeota bacterium]|nr:hypothetical protein [Candidatus Dormibacteraeota bacterium]
MFHARAWRRAVLLLAAPLALAPMLFQPIPAAGVSPTGTLFAITGTTSHSFLSSIDPAAGTVNPIEDLAGPNSGQITSLTGDPSTHRLFMIRTSTIFNPFPPVMQNELLTVDSQTGVLLSHPLLTGQANDLEFDTSTGSLFGLSNIGVVTVDPATGSVMAFATVGTPGSFISIMAVAPATHTIYVSKENIGLPGPPSTQIFVVDSKNGVVTTSFSLLRAVRFIVYDTSLGALFGTTDCCPRDLVSIDAVGNELVKGNVNGADTILQTGPEIDSSSNTLFMDIQRVISQFVVEDHLLSMNDRSGVPTLGPVTGTTIWSFYFEPAAAPPDTSPPTTSIALSPAPNAAGWNNANVTVNLSATDPEGIADVATIQYSAAGAQTIAPTIVAGSAASFVVNTEGVTTVTNFAKDKAGNTEAALTKVIRIDKTLPTVTYTGNAGTYTVDQTVSITCAAVDPPNANGTAASGLASTTCANVNAPAYSFPLGLNSLSASATDIAGNIAGGSSAFTVQVTSESLCTLTSQLIETSPKFLSLSPQAQKRWDRFAQRTCEIFDQGEGEHGPDDKAEKVKAYKEALTHLVDKGFLTPAQAATLLSLARAL